MLRGRIVSANGIQRRRSESARRTPPGCCKATAASPMRATCRPARASSRANGGAPDYQGPPLVSFEKQDRRWARPEDRRPGRRQRARPQHHGDARQHCARSTGKSSASISCWSIRRAHSAARRTPISRPSPIRAAASARGRRSRCSRRPPTEFPTVTAVRVHEALEAVGKVVLDLTLAIRGASAITLIAAVLVLAGALAAGHRHRVYDAVVLKTLGATRRAAARRLRARISAARARDRDRSASRPVRSPPGMVMTEVMNLAFVWLPLAGARRDARRARR